MKLCANIISYGALFVLVLTSILFLVNQLDQDRMKTIMLAASIVWFVAALRK